MLKTAIAFHLSRDETSINDSARRNVAGIGLATSLPSTNASPASPARRCSSRLKHYT
jgi:hypothetical protein